MTKKEFHAYINSLLPYLRLNHWTIEVSDKPPRNDSAWASVTCWDGRCGATVYLSDAILKESPENQRYVVAHELTHCHFAHPDRLLDDELAPAKNAAWTLAMEYAVDAIANAFTPFLPLPPEYPADGPPQPA